MIKVIAEIGINHNGSIERAKELIDAAVDCGCDAVKFQKRTIDIVYTKEFLDSPRDSPWGSTQREQKEGLEFDLEQFEEIDKYCSAKKIEWFSSSWDVESQKQMRRFNFSNNKVASAMATNHQFVNEVASEKIHTYVSTGMMDLCMIDDVVNIFLKHGCPFTLMHTVSTYPAEESDLNLKCIQTLQERYKCNVGYSGHEVSVFPSLIAAMLGATCIERHITLDRAMYGSDQSASLEPRGFREMTSMLKKIPKCTGDGVVRILPEEEIIAKKLRYWA